MVGDDDTSAKIDALNAELAEVEIKAATGDEMYLVRAKFLRSKLASLTTARPPPEPAVLPQALRMAALNTVHTEAKAKSEEKSAQKNLEGSAQVTVVSDVPSDNCPTNMSESLAGASPHAPRRPETKQSSQSKGDKVSFRMPEGMKPMLEAKAAAVKSYPSAYILGLIAADLGIPINEEKLKRDREVAEEIAALTVALNRQGNNFNQISKSAHEGKPCALSQPQISETLQQHRAAVSAILRLGFG
jgi:hypothetical protein